MVIVLLVKTFFVKKKVVIVFTGMCEMGIKLLRRMVKSQRTVATLKFMALSTGDRV